MSMQSIFFFLFHCFFFVSSIEIILIASQDNIKLILKCSPVLFCEFSVFSEWMCHFCAMLLLQEKFEDTKGVTRNRKSKKNRQYNGQKKMDRNNKQLSTKHCKKNKD